MSCFFPLRGYKTADPLTGEVIPKVKITGGVAPVGAYKSFLVPCQQCRGCRKSKCREWAMRCMHEAKMYFNNCFITLTYDDGHLPPGGSLVKNDFVCFIERLRYKFPHIDIRYFYCGEYGPKYSRPHFHALLFNFDFPDKYFWKVENDENYFRSSILESLWSYGFSIIGNVSFASASYVSSYITKKLTGKASSAYGGKLPEFADMSRRPGIGHGWYNQYKHDVYPSDQVVIGKNPFSPPRYYDKLIEKEKPVLLEKLKKRRVIRAQKFASEQSLTRRQTRSKFMSLKNKAKKRSYENE